MGSGLSFLWGKAEDNRIPKWQSWKRLDRELTSPLSLEIMTVCIKFTVWWYSLCPERRTPHFVNYPDLCSKLLRNRKFQNCRLVQTKPRLPRISKDLASGHVPHLLLWIHGGVMGQIIFNMNVQNIQKYRGLCNMGKPEVPHPSYGELWMIMTNICGVSWFTNDFSPMPFYLIPITQMNKLRHRKYLSMHIAG